MRSERLTAALNSGAFAWPEEGRVLILRPRAEDYFDGIPADRLQVVTGFRPDFDAFSARRIPVAAKVEGAFSAALVCLPRARDLSRAMLVEAVAALPEGAPVWVDGQKTDGIESVLKDLKGAGLAPGEAYSKAHGKIFMFRAAPLPQDWAAQDHQVDGFITRPGVFSADGIDRGSALLAAALPEKLHSRVGDFGAGWGYLSSEVLKRPGVQDLHLIEAEAEALDCARRNITDPRAQFHWADATTFKAEVPFGVIVCNPPFHTAREADPKLGIAFLQAAARNLTTSGTLWLVANKQLPYEPELQKLFREVEMIGGDNSFRLWRASRPIQGKGAK